MTHNRGRKPWQKKETLAQGGILKKPFTSGGDRDEAERVFPLPPGMKIEVPRPGSEFVFRVSAEKDAEEAAIEHVASELGLDEEKLGAAEVTERFDEIVANEVKALHRRGLGLTPVFDVGKSLRDRLGSKVPCFETAPEGRPGPAWTLCSKREFVFDPKKPEQDYLYEVEVVADSDAELASVIDALFAAANQVVLFAGLRVWLHAAGRHGQPAMKIAGGQVEKIVELIFRATQP